MTRTRRVLIGLGVTVVSLTALGFAALLPASFGARAAGDRLARMQASPQFTDGIFVNAIETKMEIEGKPLQAAWDWISNDAQVKPDVDIPLAVPGDLAPVGDDRIRVTWMGHSSMLIELDGHLVLTDPVWGPRASPYGFVGPARFHPPPMPLEDLPRLDAVLLSHDHYDHLDYPTILGLLDRDVPFVVPLGVGAHLVRWGVPPQRIVELDWWEEHQVVGLRLVSTPARHFPGRGPTDRNATLWSSWALIGASHRAWFSGDTGPAPFFDEVGEKLGPFDVTMLEIGAWHATWSTIHLGPEAAVALHGQLGGGVLVPIHWGTFNLALHDWDAPVVELVEYAQRAGATIAVPIVGDTVDPASPRVDPFWLGRVEAAAPVADAR